MKESEIIKKIVDGDRELFNDIILEHQDFVFNVVKNIVKFEQDAEDLTQKVFLKAYNNIDKFRGDSKLSSWLYKIAYNLSLNFSRKEKTEIQIDGDLLLNTKSTEDEYDKIFEKEEILSNLNKILEVLDDKYRIVIKLYYFEDKSYEEIANILGLPINTVKIHLLRAKNVIAKKLGN